LNKSLSCYNDKAKKTLLNYLVEKAPSNCICTNCNELATSPRQLWCCRSIICYQCASLLGNKCPIKACLKYVGGMTYCETCCNIDKEIDALRIHCLQGKCGWAGPIKLYAEHKQYCSLVQFDDLDRIVVAEYDRGDVNKKIANFAERMRNIQLEEPLHFKSGRAGTLVLNQMNRIDELVDRVVDSEDSNVEVDEEEINALLDAPGIADRERIGNTNKDGGNLQTFKNSAWVAIHKKTIKLATALFGDMFDEWNCVDMGSGLLFACLSGSILSSKMRWVGLEIENDRVKLGVEIYKIVDKQWRGISKRELKVSFFHADCCGFVNLRGYVIPIFFFSSYLVLVANSSTGPCLVATYISFGIKLLTRQLFKLPSFVWLGRTYTHFY